MVCPLTIRTGDVIAGFTLNLEPRPPTPERFMASVESITLQLPAESGLNASRSVTSAMPAEGRLALAEEALATWLRWNAVYEQVTGAMFDQRSNLQQMRETFDLADELRRKAVALAQKLLGE
jgi:hypothetical protein